MHKKLLLILSLFSCLYLDQLQAQGIAGGEVYYELVGPKKYKVTANVYRMCEFGALNGISGYVIGSSTMQTFVVFTRVSIQKINDTCNNPCKVQNATSTAGFEKHTFEATVDFNTTTYKSFVTNNICKVYFAVKVSGRPVSTTHGNGLLYLDAMVNLCDTNVKKNHSPVFSMDPKFHAACNQPLMYSPGPLDTFDYDSLGFDMMPIQNDYNTFIAYSPNYSGTIPMTPYCPPNPNTTNCKPLPNSIPPRGFYFDNSLCQIIFTPTKCTDKGYMKIRVSEYRRNPLTKQMDLIGYINREMLVQVKQVTNNNVVELSSTNSILNICTNNALATAKTKDLMASPNQAKNDTTHLVWDKGYKLSTFTIVDTSRERTADIILKKDSSLKQLKSQYFTVAAYDKRCNISLISKTFLAIDQPFTRYKIDKNINSCHVWNYKINSSDTSNPNDIKSTVTIRNASSKTLFSSQSNADSFTFNSNGRHIVEYNLSNYPFTCIKTVYDTVDISNAFFQGMLSPGNDSMVCAPYGLQIKFNPYKSPGTSKIEWFRNGQLFNSKDSSISMTIDSSSNFLLRLTDNNGCRAESRLNYAIKQHNVLPDFALTQCKNSMASFTAIINTLQAPITYKWSLNGKDTAITGRTLDFVLRDTTKVRITIKDNNNCVFSDSVDANIKTSFSFTLKKSKAEICTDSSLSITASNITALQPYKLLWRVSKTDSLEDDTVLTRNYKSNRMVVISITDANSCPLIDSILIAPVTTPRTLLPKFSAVCEGDLINMQPTFIPDVYPKTYKWIFNGTTSPVTDSTFSFRIRKSSMIGLRAYNKLGCYSDDSSDIPMNPRPVFNILSNVNYHHAHKITVSTDKAFKSYQWFNSVYTRNDTFWAFQLGAPGKHTIWCVATDDNGCNGGDTIDIFTDKLVNIQAVDMTQSRIYPNPGSNELHLHVEKDCRMLLINAEGKILIDQYLPVGTTTLDTRMLATGFYFIRIDDAHFTWLKE